MTAFDPTPLRTDAPAMPVIAHTDDTWNGQVPHMPGLTARQYAAIALRVPDSGTEWLDAMIRASLRDQMSTQIVSAMVGFGGALAARVYTESAYELADAMLVKSKPADEVQS